jgi:nitronate monooxygenase
MVKNWKVKLMIVKDLTTKPFAVNLFVPSNNEIDNGLVEHMQAWLKPYRKAFNLEEPVVNITEQQQFEQAIDIIINKQVPIVAFTFGIPDQEINYQIESTPYYFIRDCYIS